MEKQTIFYFAGRAGDLPLALLRHENNELAKLNEKVKGKTAKVLHTISHLVSAAKINADGPNNPNRFNRSRHIRQILENGN